MKNITNREKLILSLIKDDLINTKLIHGLNKLGLDSSKYSLNLINSIFELMEIEDNLENEHLFHFYYNRTNQLIESKTVNLIDDSLSLQLYYEVFSKRKKG